MSGIVLALSARRAFEKVLVEVCDDLPGDLLKAVKAKTFENGVLTVKCPGLMTTELSMRSGELIKELNSQIGKRIVLKIRFRAG